MRKILTIILLLSLTFSYGQEKITSDKLTLNYDIKYLKSKYYPDEERVLKVFLPENYDASRKYPVIYTLDGESLFKTLAQNISILQDNSLDESNIIPECITIGIDNTNRGRDLTPNYGEDSNFPLGTFREGTETFYKILNDEIVPFINTNYSTSGFNVLIGHSNSGHFATQQFLADNNNFRGIIAFSVSDYGREYFQEKLLEKLNIDKSKVLFFGYGTKDDEFNKLGQYLKKQNLSNQNLLVKSYNADHIQLPNAGLFDALKFMFSDYKYFDDLIDKTYNNNFDYETFENLYVENIYKRYGIQIKIDTLDFYYLMNKARDKNDEYVFNKLLDKADEAKLFQLQLRFYAAYEFNQNERAKTYLHKMLLSDDETDKLIFFATLKSQYYDFYVNRLNEPLEFIDFVEQAKEKWSEYTLEFNYLILKTLINKKIKSSKKKKYYRYCKQNFKENRYFKMEDLEK